MPTTPEWSLPWPLISAQADVPADMQLLAEATDAALSKVTTQVVQSGLATATVSAGATSGSVVVTFPTPFASAPVVTATTAPTSGGDPAGFYYAVAIGATTTQVTLRAYHRTDNLPGQESVRMSWIATGDVA